MVSITEGKHAHFFIDFAWEKDGHIRSYRLGLEEVFEGKYLETLTRGRLFAWWAAVKKRSWVFWR